MKHIQSGHGVTDLGSVAKAAGEDLAGRGEKTEITVDQPVKEGPPDRTVTFTGRAAEEFRRVKHAGYSDEGAIRYAEEVQRVLSLAEAAPDAYIPEEFADPANWHPVAEDPVLSTPPTRVTEPPQLYTMVMLPNDYGHIAIASDYVGKVIVRVKGRGLYHVTFPGGHMSLEIEESDHG